MTGQVSTAGSLRSLVPYTLALLSGGIWGLTFSLARMATEAGKQPLGLAFWQAFGGALVLLVYCLFMRLKPRFSAANWLHFFVIGTVGSALPGTLLFYAAPHVPVGILAITIALVPMQTFGASLLLGVDRFSAQRLWGVVLGFGSIVLIMLPGVIKLEGAAEPTQFSNMHVQIWVLIALVATVSYTIENMYIDRCVSDESPIAPLLMMSLFIAALMLLPLIWVTDTFVSIALPFDRIDGVLIAMSVVSSVAYLMFLTLIKLAGPVFASMSGYVVTLSGVFWGMALFGESHSLWIWLALALMLVGLVLVTPKREPVQL